MQLDVTHVRGDRDSFERRYAPEAFGEGDRLFRVVEPVALAFDIVKDDRRFHLVGTMRTTLELACGRCLEPFRLPIDAPFDLRYLPRAENDGEGEIEIEEDDLATAFYADDLIDLGQLMAEQFHLALPMKPLCSVSCQGLCPRCGLNRNTGTCACRTDWEDPRLAALKVLRERGTGVPAQSKDGE